MPRMPGSTRSTRPATTAPALRRAIVPSSNDQCCSEPQEQPGADDDPGQGGPALREEVVPVGGEDVAGDRFGDGGCDGSGGKGHRSGDDRFGGQDAAAARAGSEGGADDPAAVLRGDE